MSQPTYVFIHGAGMNGEVWRTLAGALGSGNFVFLDLPGHGAASGPGLETIEAMASFVVSRLDRYDRPVLVGHSMGALVALAAAAQAPEKTGGLVLIGANEKMPVNPQLLQAAAEQPDAASAMILKWGIAKTAQPSVRAALEAVMRQTGPGLLARDLTACDLWQGAASAAGKIKAPVLVIAGADDKMAPPSGGAALAGLFSSGKNVCLAATGHMAMVENPMETAQHIVDFIGVNRA